jgi:hypothetical protein
MGSCRIACLVCLPLRIFFLTLHYISHLSSSSSFFPLSIFHSAALQHSSVTRALSTDSPLPLLFPSPPLISSSLLVFFLPSSHPSFVFSCVIQRPYHTTSTSTNRFNLDTFAPQQRPQQPSIQHFRHIVPSLYNPLHYLPASSFTHFLTHFFHHTHLPNYSGLFSISHCPSGERQLPSTTKVSPCT